MGFDWPDPSAVCVGLVRVPDVETVEHRVHTELATSSEAHQAELVARLKDLGPTPVEVGQGDVPWTMPADPEGNEFCVPRPRLTRSFVRSRAAVRHCAPPASGQAELRVQGLLGPPSGARRAKG